MLIDKKSGLVAVAVHGNSSGASANIGSSIAMHSQASFKSLKQLGRIETSSISLWEMAILF